MRRQKRQHLHARLSGLDTLGRPVIGDSRISCLDRFVCISRSCPVCRTSLARALAFDQISVVALVLEMWTVGKVGEQGVTAVGQRECGAIEVAQRPQARALVGIEGVAQYLVNQRIKDIQHIVARDLLGHPNKGQERRQPSILRQVGDGACLTGDGVRSQGRQAAGRDVGEIDAPHAEAARRVEPIERTQHLERDSRLPLSQRLQPRAAVNCGAGKELVEPAPQRWDQRLTEGAPDPSGSAVAHPCYEARQSCDAGQEHHVPP